MSIKFDGNKSFIDLLKLSNQDPFKFIIENCYFIDKEIAKTDFDNVYRAYKEGKEPISVRYKKSASFQKEKNDRKHTDDKEKILKYQKNNKLFLKYNNELIYVKIDSDGNKALRDKIKAHTGFKVSNGKDSDITSCIISHIFDSKNEHPILFSCLFNIVVVPTWLDHFIDKHNIYLQEGINTKDFFKGLIYNYYCDSISIDKEIINIEKLDKKAFEKSKNYIKYIKPKLKKHQ